MKCFNAQQKQSNMIFVVLLLFILIVFVDFIHRANDHITTYSILLQHGNDGVASVSGRNVWDYKHNPLQIPPGQAEALPSIRITEDLVDKKEDGTNDFVDDKRKIYGGKGDKKHLGGFTELDINGISPSVWKHMISNFGVHSVIDIGCGRGISTSWFALHNCSVICAEGSHDAIEQSMVPNKEQNVIEHDFSRGPWWPEKTYDAVWSVEFLEHVGVQYHFNYIAAFRKAALIFVTSSRWGGWHHVEVHLDDWWIQKYESYGFKYDDKLTQQVRNIAQEESMVSRNRNNSDTFAPNGEHYNGQHIYLSMKVFINPMVASLPEHAHLFPQHGCYGGRNATHIIGRECGTSTTSDKQAAALETPLPKELFPIDLTKQMDTDWYNLVRSNIKTIK
jgi:Methyltransferase domain